MRKGSLMRSLSFSKLKMIHRQQPLVAFCDRCGCGFFYKGTFANKSELVKRMKLKGWILIGKKCYCTECKDNPDEFKE